MSLISLKLKPTQIIMAPDSSANNLPWAKNWPGIQGFSSSFPRSFPSMIRRLGPQALKITLFKAEAKLISLTIAGRYVCRWSWIDENWQQSCNCQTGKSFCLHSYILVNQVDKLLGKKFQVPDFRKPNSVMPKAALNQRQVPLARTRSIPIQTSTPTPFEPWKLTVEIERNYSDSQAAIRFYQDFDNDRRLCVMQNLYNFSAQCYNKRGISSELEALDARFLGWLFEQVKPYHIYRSQEKLLKITRKKLDEWLNTWKDYPGRFIDRLTGDAVLSHCEFRAFIEPEINDKKVRLHCLIGPTREQAKAFHYYLDKFKDRETIALGAGNIPFNCPVPMKVLLHCFKSSKVPTIPLAQACKFLPELLQGHTEVLSGDFVEQQGTKQAPIKARLEQQSIIVTQEISSSNLQLKNDKFIVKGKLPNEQFPGLKKTLQGEDINADSFSIPLKAGSLEGFLQKWPSSGTLDPQLHQLQQPQSINKQFSIIENSDGTQRLEVHWDISGRSVSPRDLEQAIHSSGSFFRSSDGDWFNLDKEQLQSQTQLLEEFGISPAGSARIHPLNIARLPLDDLPVSPNSKDALQEILSRYNNAKPKAPKVNCDLRNYQVEGYEFLWSLGQSQCGALLADDMGLGKTVQTLACLSHSQGSSLIVCPSSLLDNWQKEARKFTPHLETHIIRGNLDKRSEIYDEFDTKKGLFIISYSLVRNDLNTLKKLKFDHIILDEAQNIKNSDSQVSRAIRQLNSKRRIALSGTPIENSADDLWSIMEFLNPGLNGSKEDFRSLCQGDSASLVIKRLRPFMLRRTKKMAAPELPPKTFIPLDIPMSDVQSDLYQREMRQARQSLKAGNAMNVLASLTRLRQLSCHSAFGCPEEYRPDPDLPLSQRSPKSAAFIEKAKDLMAEGHSCLFFSQFTGILKEIEKELHQENIPTHMITGETPSQKRAAIVDEFSDSPSASVFLLSLKAAGTGLNLTRASYVFIFDPWWNPAAENQAIDRSHRIGQENPVIIYRMISSDSVEEKVAALQAEKQKLFDQIIEQDEFTSSSKLQLSELASLLD
ncbi:DEAD/DEAH box helicase [Lentisphaera profundi]|uniref:DEAD/DEAH box helicase n=1 Tax=Lentisphaera profundi TaxID=1658616 RepID=A0ABY7VV32_9BACT|nr:DEAD/DEAH box helicase [Lentisphaera profundi]WDE96747.1 DEAD/DEAH box helicase [Lentisphaera profundi]